MGESVSSTAERPSISETARPARPPGWPVAMRGIWSTLTSPWLLLVLSLALVLLAGIAFVLPQLPGQLYDEPTAAERWLTNSAEEFGALGPLLRSAGLFAVLRSPLLQGVVALMVFVLFVQFARFTLAAYQLRRVPAVLDQTGTINGEPLPVVTAGALLRWRGAVPSSSLTLTNELQRLLEARLRHVDRRTVRVVLAPLPHDGAPGDAAHDPITLEERLLAVRGVQPVLLRPLLVAGMLCAMAFIWLNMVFGWQFMPASLIPGERTTDAVHNVRFEYRLDQLAPGLLSPLLQATVGEASSILPVQNEMRTRIGPVDVTAHLGAPALVVRTVDGAPLLARPGQVNAVAMIGLGFPSAGSEETLIIPTEAIGLRVVRLEQGALGPVEDSFLVEVYQAGSENAIMRVNIGESEIINLPAANGPLALALVPLPSLALQARQMPGIWLLWPAAILIVVGAFGFWRQAGFVLAQVGPWPEERTVITLQSDLPGEMASLRRWYAGQQSPESKAGSREAR